MNRQRDTMNAVFSPGSTLAWVATVALLLAGCATGINRAPVEQRDSGSRGPAATTPGSAPDTPAMVPPANGASDNAGKPGYYSVKPGDTLIRIGLDNGQNWRDIARWNNLDNVNLIEVGQVLRVVPPGVDASGAVARPVAGAARVETKPLDGKSATPAAAAASAAVPAPPPPAVPAGAPPAPRDSDGDLGWIWPASGSVVAGFEEGRSKGLVIAGKIGDPVLAAADGRVVYAGSGLRGYGNLIIIKHNETYLTAYAHNQALLVKDDQAVRRGQRIADMGSTDAERVQLHFEIRRLGKPMDPTRLLPPR